MKLPLIYCILYYVAESPAKWIWLTLAIVSFVAQVYLTSMEVVGKRRK